MDADAGYREYLAAIHAADSPAEVLARLRAAGFTARTLHSGYARQPLPRGLTAYVGRKR